MIAPFPPPPLAFAQASVPRPVLIAVPLYRRPDLAEQVVGSLIRCAPDIQGVMGEVVLYNDSPDDGALASALPKLLARAGEAFPCRLESNPRNLGFVRTANRALDEAARRGMDVLLLNSDTVVTPGALSEMVRVSRLDPMTGFVNPRSNNATLATLPYQDRFRHLPPEPARQAWAALADHLPDASYVPTANGFCMLIRWSILAEFGGFDEIYAKGYNEENDLAMRAGRRGYRAVLANHAFVWHEGSASFGLDRTAQALETQNRAKLLARYPEYPGLTEAYFNSPEQRAEQLLGTLIPDACGRLDVALDFSSFVPAHNGTFEAGGQLLKAAAQAWGDRFNLHVLCAEDTYAFHGYARWGVPRRDPHGPEFFAAIFRVGQPFDWNAVQRIVMKAATFGVFMLDTIALDCSNLADSEVQRIWAFTLEHADLVAATSRLTDDQLTRRFAFGRDTLRVRSLHSLDLADYRPVAEIAPPPAPPGYVFVVGNHYWHKDAASAVNALARADPDRTVVVLSGTAAPTSVPVDAGRYAPVGLHEAPNVVTLEAGGLTPAQMGALYRNAGVVVLPSHYEGFGIPVLNALAARKPVFVRPLPVFAELWTELGGDANMHVFATTDELVRVMTDPPAWDEAGAAPGKPGDAARAARDIGCALDAIIARATYPAIVKRVGAVRHCEPAVAAPRTPAAFIARRVGQRVEQAAAAVLRTPGVLTLLRTVFRLLRPRVAADAR